MDPCQKNSPSVQHQQYHEQVSSQLLRTKTAATDYQHKNGMTFPLTDERRVAGDLHRGPMPTCASSPRLKRANVTWPSTCWSRHCRHRSSLLLPRRMRRRCCPAADNRLQYTTVTMAVQLNVRRCTVVWEAKTLFEELPGADWAAWLPGTLPDGVGSYVEVRQTT